VCAAAAGPPRVGSPGPAGRIAPTSCALPRSPLRLVGVGVRTERCQWGPHHREYRLCPYCCGDCGSRGVADPEDPPPSIPPSLVVAPHPVINQPPPPLVAHQGYTVAALAAACAEHAARQARLREAALMWEREREAADAIAAQIAATEQLLASPTAHDTGPPPLHPSATCTASRPHRLSTPGPAPSPRCSGMTRLTRLWLSSTFRLGVSRTFVSWFLSSSSQSHCPTHAGGTYSSLSFVATPWMTTSSATSPAWR
jgi:hypothetical protein